jgi:hypothetical protein
MGSKPNRRLSGEMGSTPLRKVQSDYATAKIDRHVPDDKIPAPDRSRPAYVQLEREDAEPRAFARHLTPMRRKRWVVYAKSLLRGARGRSYRWKQAQRRMIQINVWMVP